MLIAVSAAAYVFRTAPARHPVVGCVLPAAAEHGGCAPVTDPARLPDDDVTRLPDGTYFNRRLGALNVFEIDVDETLVDEAADIFYGTSDGLCDNGSSPFDRISQMTEPYLDVDTRAGRFFTQRVTGWKSNIAWVAVDDEHAFRRFESLFERLLLPQRFASVVPHRRALRLYSAFYVVRSKCDAHSFHTDYMKPVGPHALTLITPLRDYRETASFQLTYKPAMAAGEVQRDGRIVLGAADAEDLRERPALQRYEYRRGKAIVFGSRFEHSTETGAGHEGEVHAYLCFTFGTDDQARWDDIAQTLDTQSRIVQHPDGKLGLSALGRAIEEALASFKSAR